VRCALRRAVTFSGSGAAKRRYWSKASSGGAKGDLHQGKAPNRNDAAWFPDAPFLQNSSESESVDVQ
jgi:hypothetical protein